MAANEMSKKSGDQNQRFVDRVFQGEVDLVKTGAGGGLSSGEREIVKARKMQFDESAKRSDLLGLNSMKSTLKKRKGMSAI